MEFLSNLKKENHISFLFPCTGIYQNRQEPLPYSYQTSSIFIIKTYKENQGLLPLLY